METLLTNIQNKIAEITGIKYVDEDWGQLDYYSPNVPVQFPCCLIDLNDGDFSNIGQDLTKNPRNRQNGKLTVRLTLANVKLTNTSFKAPQSQKDKAWVIIGLMEEIHAKIHGFSPDVNCSKMLRVGLGKTKRDDGIQEYVIYYTFEAGNV
ncbi:hypothetical protein GCM10022217_15940 [Chryseobacterium ginsenosidimutans]|uniref:hypothetical protein n=1 Tax=Chryseobacterium ginsenosidimutans TaxID=687846 RepID=UPI0031D8D498